MSEWNDGTVCAMCDKAPVVVINQQPLCMNHIDDGFRLAFRGVAILRGMDEELIPAAENKAARMFREANRKLYG